MTILTETRKGTLDEIALSAQFADASRIFVHAGTSSAKSLADLFVGKKHLYFTEGINSERIIFAFNDSWNLSDVAIYHIPGNKINNADGYENFIDLLSADIKPVCIGQEAINFMKKRAEEHKYYV